MVGESIDIGHFESRQRRPGLEQALAAAQNRAFDVLVTAKPDRLSRRADQFLAVLDAFRQAGVEVQFTHSDAGSAADNLIWLRMMEQAEYPMETQAAYRQKK